MFETTTGLCLLETWEKTLMSEYSALRTHIPLLLPRLVRNSYAPHLAFTLLPTRARYRIINAVPDASLGA